MSPKLKKERYSVIKYERLKELLKDENMTLSALAEKICVDYPNLSRALNKGEIQISWLNSIAEIMDISVKYLTGETSIKLRRFVDERDKYNSKEIIGLYLISRGFEIDDLMTEKLNRLTDNEMYDIDVLLLNLLAGKNFINPEILKALNNNSSK